MDSFELNKILGAILGTLLFIMGVGFLAEAIYQPASGVGPGYDLPEPASDETGGGGNGPTTPAVVDIGTLLAAADPKAGESAVKKCSSCHDFTKGGPNKTGPNLYGIVGEQIADTPGYTFSDALLAHKADTWTYENLNQWLISPKTFAPGTKMTYAGDKDDQDRANIIAYLSTLSDSPVPFPPPAAPGGGETPTSSQVTDTTSSEAPPASSEQPAPAPSSSEAAPAPSSSEAPAAPSSSSAPAPAPSSSEAPVASSSAAPAAPSSSETPAPASSSSAP